MMEMHEKINKFLLLETEHKFFELRVRDYKIWDYIRYHIHFCCIFSRKPPSLEQSTFNFKKLLYFLYPES